MTFQFKLAKRLAINFVAAGVAVTVLACAADRGVGIIRPSASVVRVHILPDNPLLDPGQAIQFQASGITSAGDSLPIDVTWAATAGTITSSGLYTSDTTAQDAQISASYYDVTSGSTTTTSGTTKVRKSQVVQVVLAPSTDTLATGASQTFTATGVRSSGSRTSINAIFSATGGSITSAGTYTAGQGSGKFAVVAQDSRTGIVDTAPVVIYLPSVASVSVTPAAPSVLAGGTVQLSAITKDSTGNTLAGRTITWASSNTAIATVASTGLVTGVAVGTTTITATSGGYSGSATLTVSAVPVASVSVTPTSANLSVGGTVQLNAAAKDSAGNTLSGRTVTWASGNTAVATVSASGLVTGVAAGSATITATSEGKSGSSSLAVVQVPVASVTVSPASASLYGGQTAQLSVVTKDSAGNTLSGRTVTWASGNTAVATVSGTGLVTGLAVGSATITATSEGKSGSAAVTVSLVPVASVAVSPVSTSVAAGGTVQLSAVAKDSAGNTLTGRTFTWSSSNTTVASVSGSGLVGGLVAGSATITATSGGKSGSSAVTVTSVSVTHNGWYVSPNGSSGGTGGSSSPWTLSYALSGAGGKIQAGDTVWVRGGTYYAPFQSSLTGTASAPIVVRAFPGERAIIDGVNTTSDNFVVTGAYSVIWGLEFTNTNPSRYTSDATSHSYRADDIVNNGPHNKYVNVIVHDGGVAFYTYSSATDVEITGGIFYNNGWDSSDRGHGHALYLKNDNGPVVARDNIIFNQFGYGIHMYTNTGDGLLNGLQAIGNVSFDNGSLSALGTSANLGNLGQPLANNMVVQNNMTYFAPSLSGTNLTLGSGSGLMATGNYVVGGDGITEGTWTGATVSNNTVLAAGPASQNPVVFIRSNAYEPGRANIIVYNWNQQGSVSLDLTAVLPVGAKYEIRNVQDLFGAPVASGTFGGGAVTLPIVAVLPPVPVGMSTSPAPSTGVAFNVYVVTVTP